VDTVDTQALRGAAPDAARQVTALYQRHALGLVRLAVIMLGNQAAAEDVVQDAFLGLYSHWASLSDASNALPYVRSSVLNGCRTVLRHQSRRRSLALAAPPLESAEASALIGEEHRAVLAAIRRLPDRQREALALRYYLDMSEEEIAAAMRISRGTVKSTTSRAIAALSRILREES
jgi:RNA polymerase sigma-70 factor (sigma-E family)